MQVNGLPSCQRRVMFSDAGGERAALLYSLIGSAELNGLDPESYLWDVLTGIADHRKELLPWNLIPNQSCTMEQSLSRSWPRIELAIAKALNEGIRTDEVNPFSQQYFPPKMSTCD